jgi:hypothetical protein
MTIASRPKEARAKIFGNHPLADRVPCEKSSVNPREAGRFSRRHLVSYRRINMRSPRTFVKRVNTTYCGFVLGHSQDVDKIVG